MTKTGEEHYNIISALHKSMRNSDPDAAVYWMYRMLDGGEDPLYIARRLVRFASEDVGMADSHALQVAVAAYQACHFIGMPECDVHLTHAVVYLSMAPKIQRTLHGLRGRQKGRPRSAGGTGASSDSQCADKINERSGVRQRLHLRPRH